MGYTTTQALSLWVHTAASVTRQCDYLSGSTSVDIQIKGKKILALL